jgi:hypothetical protein
MSLAGAEYQVQAALPEHSPLFHFQKSAKQSQQASVHSDDNVQLSIKIASQQRHPSFVKQSIFSKDKNHQNSSTAHFHK